MLSHGARALQLTFMASILAALALAPACSRSPSQPPPTSAPPESQRAPQPTAPADAPSDLRPPPADQQPAEPAPPPPLPQPTFVELLPGIRIDRAQRMLEFDGHIPINVNDRDTTGEFLVVFLECIVTTPLAEKDHETLVVSPIRPSNLHAALLAIGLEPGAPGDWRWDGREIQRIAARGDEVTVTFRWEEDGEVVERDPRDLIVNDRTGERFGGSSWLFAGSIEDAPAPPPDLAGAADLPPGPIYAADATGLLVGLATFGTEVIAWREVISHAADIDTPVWIANRATTPPFGTEVTVRIAVPKN